jgi:response regulator RpfG family c-di-GMP phosphodiesterase
MTLEEALKILDEGKGSQFEPKLADTFIKLIKENKELRELAG